VRIETASHLEEYRAGVRAFIAEHQPGVKSHTGVRAPAAELVPALREWAAKLYGAGYLGADWPEEYGGSADSLPEHAFIVAQELARARTWEPIGSHGLASAALIKFGTDAQKAHFLPRLRSADDIWCQLFSEPGAGSDLASLRTKARLDGDHYVIDGQKVWTTNGQHSDVGYLLARTDQDAPKHRGITAFALDMRTPGVDIRPLREITGTYDFNEVFLDSVRVPVDRVIGNVNHGWKVANSSLAHERSGVAAYSEDLLHQLNHLAELTAGSTDPTTLVRLGRLATNIHVTDLMSKAVQSHMLAGTEDAADAALVKIMFSEVNLAAAELGVAVQGIDGLAIEGDGHAIADGWWQDALLYARAYTIAGGANEVLRNVVAERAFGLPREPQ